MSRPYATRFRLIATSILAMGVLQILLSFREQRLERLRCHTTRPTIGPVNITGLDICHKTFLDKPLAGWINVHPE